MKIIFVIPKMSGGGAEKVISILANWMVNNNIEIDILMTAGNDVVYSLDSRVNLESIGGATGGNICKVISRIIKMRRYFKESDNSGAVVISFGPGTSAYVVMALLGLKNRLIISERNDPAACPHPTLRNITYSKADKLVFQTDMAMRCFPTKIKQKSVVIPNPISGDIPERYIGERTKRIVNVARLEPQKNHELLINAFADFCVTHNDYTLDIYGKGSLLSSLKERALELQISDKVIFHGFSSDVKNEIKDASMFVLSSDYEGISNSMVESLAMGIPTISTDCPIGGSKAFIKDGVNGLLVPVGDVAAMTEAMCRIADDNELAQKFSDNSISIRTTCSIDKIATDFLKAAGID